MNGKSFLIKLSISFSILIVVLFFVSRSIKNLTLPIVSLGFCEENKIISKKSEFLSVAEIVSKKTLSFFENPGVLELYFTEGSLVEKNQKIYAIKSLDKKSILYEFISQEDIILTEIFKENGEYINAFENILSYAQNTEDYEAVISVGNAENFINEDSDLKINVINKNIRNLNGKLTSIKKIDKYNLELKISFKTDQYIAGEAINISAQEDTKVYLSLPNSAIRAEDTKNYILFVEKIDRPFGYSLIARKEYINVVASNEFETGFDLILDIDKKSVIINSDSFVFEGSIVRLGEVGDFIEIR